MGAAFLVSSHERLFTSSSYENCSLFIFVKLQFI